MSLFNANNLISLRRSQSDLSRNRKSRAQHEMQNSFSIKDEFESVAKDWGPKFSHKDTAFLDTSGAVIGETKGQGTSSQRPPRGEVGATQGDEALGSSVQPPQPTGPGRMMEGEEGGSSQGSKIRHKKSRPNLVTENRERKRSSFHLSLTRSRNVLSFSQRASRLCQEAWGRLEQGMIATATTATGLAATRAVKLNKRKRGAFQRLPWLPAVEEETAVVTEQGIKVSVRFERNVLERFHLLLSEPDSSRLAMFISMLVLSIIGISCLSFIIESLPSQKHYTGVSDTGMDCRLCGPAEPLSEGVDEQGNDIAVNARRGRADDCVGCQPESLPAYAFIELASSILFSIEYFARLFTAGHARSGYEKSRRVTQIDTAQDLPCDVHYEFSHWKMAKRLALFLFDPLNIVDFLAIMPFLLNVVPGIMPESSGASSTGFLRILRLFRLIRLLKLLGKSPGSKAIADGFLVFVAVFKACALQFVITASYVIFFTTFMAAVVYIFEQGTWDPETGHYLVTDGFGLSEKQESRFVSIPHAFWWCTVTISTVGYGDMSPYTTAGRVTGIITMWLGVTLMALPISIVGAAFNEVHVNKQYDVKRRRKRRDELRMWALVYFKSKFGVRDGFERWRVFARVRSKLTLSNIERFIDDRIERLERSNRGLILALTSRINEPNPSDRTSSSPAGVVVTEAQVEKQAVAKHHPALAPEAVRPHRNMRSASFHI